MTLGSLFDGIGGWCMAAQNAGVTPLWASEIEPFPCSVTARHFPEVKQLGDITQIDTAKIEPVDIVCAGSPCQDLSIAGKRKGLSGERSGLFRKAVEIVHRMRENTNGRYPRFFVWENVPGAFSSNRGMDFQTVLEEIGESKVPMPQGNKWATAGLVQFSGVEIAWRVLDAQYWGVPQRRRRIFLVADFAATDRRAGEILFECESVSGDSQASKGARERVARGIEDCTRTSGTLTPWDVQSRRIYDENSTVSALYSGDGQGTHNGAVFVRNAFCLNDQGGQSISVSHDIVGTLRAEMHGDIPIVVSNQETAAEDGASIAASSTTAYSFDALASNSMKSKNPHSGCRSVNIAKTLDTSDQNPSKNQGGIAIHQSTLYKNHAQDARFKETGDVAPTVVARYGTGGNNQPIVRHSFCILGNTIDRELHNGANGKGVADEVSYTLNTVDRHAVVDIYGAQSYSAYAKNKIATLCASGGAYGGGSENLVVNHSIVRRLTPMECERLQGLPDGYTEGGSDTARYKALGNGMAQPCADYVIRRIVEVEPIHREL